ncbi:MAG: ribbon-helix-helix domain-containing protein [Hyphomonadaceae bacterium]|nr:ribbon-helix-helix domain-containing protein [Hyphomonadaceae bacterium]
MKVKTSLTLSEDVIDAIDKLAGPGASRSAYIEKILQDFLDGRARERRIAREAAAINLHAAQLNQEMMDALAFQSDRLDE